MGNETPTYITCPHCGKNVLMDWTCSECKKAIAYDIVDDFVRTNPHKPETDRKEDIVEILKRGDDFCVDVGGRDCDTCSPNRQDRCTVHKQAQLLADRCYGDIRQTLNEFVKKLKQHLFAKCTTIRHINDPIEVYIDRAQVNDLIDKFRQEFLAQMGIADEYHIFEFKTEELREFPSKDEALKAFERLKKDNPPGIWQLFCNHKIIAEFIGG